MAFGVTGHRVVGAGHLRAARRPFSHAALTGPAPADDPFRAGQDRGAGHQVSRHCTYHGVALNVAMDLEPYSRINPQATQA